jgi:plastocyanin
LACGGDGKPTEPAPDDDEDPPPVPVTATVTASGMNFFPVRARINAGGTVMWSFADLHSVKFTGPVPPDGDIPSTASGSVSRTFPSAGTYDYFCTVHGMIMTGTVIVE